MDTSLISVVIACHNQGMFVARTIESALRQVHSPLEIVVVNDGSTDETAQVLARFPQIRVLDCTNRNVSLARNAGWRESRGDFVLFLDADDELEAHALSHLFGKLQKNRDCDLAFGRLKLIDCDGAAMSRDSCIPRRPPADNRDFYREMLRDNFIWPPGCVLFRRAVFEKTGGFSGKFRTREDYEFFLRVLQKHRAVFLDETVVNYRRHAANKTSRFPEPTRVLLRIHCAQWRHVAPNPRLRALWFSKFRALLKHGVKKTLRNLERRFSRMKPDH